MGGGRLWEVVAYGRWSLMGGGRLWEVVVQGGSTVQGKRTQLQAGPRASSQGVPLVIYLFGRLPPPPSTPCPKECY